MDFDGLRRAGGCCPAVHLFRQGALNTRWKIPCETAVLVRCAQGKGVLERTSGLCWTAVRADHIDDRAQSGRDLPVPGIIEEEPFERWRPVFEHADQLS